MLVLKLNVIPFTSCLFLTSIITERFSIITQFFSRPTHVSPSPHNPSALNSLSYFDSGFCSSIRVSTDPNHTAFPLPAHMKPLQPLPVPPALTPPSLLLAALQTPQALSPQTWLLPKNTLRPNTRRWVSSDAIPTSFPKHRMKQPQEPQPRRTSPSSLSIPIPQKEAVLFTSFIWTFKSEERTKQRAKQIIHSF